MIPHSAARQSGFSLIEVLIALLVLAVGLLGLSALQAQGLRGGTSAHQRSQAVVLAYDMMERMRSNRLVAMNGQYNTAMGADPGPGDGAAPIVDDDIGDWFQNGLSLLPLGDGSINCDNAGVCTVTVQWDDSRSGGGVGQQFIFVSQI